MSLSLALALSALRIKRSAFDKGLCRYAGFFDSDNDYHALSSDDAGRKLSNPKASKEGRDKVATWDLVTFGNYWQGDTTGDQKVDQDDEKQPVLWWVLSVDENAALLLSDQNLDGKPYNVRSCATTWETCTLRSWLNGYGVNQNACGIDYEQDNFLFSAFSSEEREAILQSELENKSKAYGVNGGNATQDWISVCLLRI